MEYQITVSYNGLFMFRTEWDSHKERVDAAATTIKSSMPLATVQLCTRDASFTVREVE